MNQPISLSARWVWVLAAITLVAGACSYRQEKGGAAAGPDAQSRVSSGSVPSFAQVRDQVFAPKCTSCHKHSNDFKDYASTYARRDEIRHYVFELPKSDSDSMPKNDSLSADQASLLKTWLDGGAPEEGRVGAPAPAPVPPVTPSPTSSAPTGPIAATWANVQSHFFARYCTHCHGGAQPDAKLDLSQLDQVRLHAQDIADRVLGDEFVDGWSMPPKEQAFNRIKADDKLVFVNWWLANKMPGPDGATVNTVPTPSPSSSPNASSEN